MKILLAEEDITIRLLMESLLSNWGFEVITATNGEEALAVLEQDDHPGIAILDWIMPVISGIDICSKLKRTKDDKDIYIFLMSSKTEKSDIAHGLDAGANDYLTKPFNSVELRSRLNVAKRFTENNIELKKQNLKIKEYATKMERLAEERAEQLIQADKMATLGMMSAGIAHEINNPNTFISSNMQTLNRFWDDVIKDALIDKQKNSDDNRIEFILKEFPELIESAKQGVTRIRKIVDGLKVYSRKDPGKVTLSNLNNCIKDALLISNHAIGKSIEIKLDLEEPAPQAIINMQQMEQVFINLIVNAADAIKESKDAGTITITSKNENKLAVISIKDDGPGIPEKIIKKIFNPFFTTKEVGKGTGLGLAISHNIINNHKGEMIVKNNDIGAEFIIKLKNRK